MSYVNKGVVTVAVGLAVPLLYAGLTGRRPWSLGVPRDTRTALGGARGVHVRESVHIARPAAEVFAEWRRLDQLPAAMPGLERVTQEGGRRSHWAARGPGGIPVEWDAEIINEEQDRLIAWRTLPGSDVQSAGSVRFTPTKGAGTRVDVHLQYAGPGGRATAVLARLMGRDPARQVRGALRRFKQALETDAGPRESRLSARPDRSA